jgi:hypothetical protein
MSLSSQAFPVEPGHPGKIKHLFLRAASIGPQEYTPRFYVEAKIDFADVRSGYHMTCGINNVLDLLPFEGDSLWTRDMVRSVDPAAIQTSKPETATLGRLPEFVTEDLLSRVETQYLSFLLRHAEVRIFRNFALNVYSNPGETRDDFIARCLDEFKESFRSDLDAFRDAVNRRLERIERKYVAEDRPGGFESDRAVAQERNKLHDVAERIAEFFLRTELTLDACVEVPPYPDPARSDLDQCLETLEVDVRQGIQRLLNSYQEKVLNVDEYIIHPNLRDLHLVRAGILWMPEGALEQ